MKDIIIVGAWLAANFIAWVVVMIVVHRRPRRITVQADNPESDADSADIVEYKCFDVGLLETENDTANESKYTDNSDVTFAESSKNPAMQKWNDPGFADINGDREEAYDYESYRQEIADSLKDLLEPDEEPQD